jgi:hypothetical protein
MASLLPDEGEALTTGWEPGVPAGDSLVRGAVLAHASWAVTPARELGRPWHDGDGWAAGQSTDRVALANWVVIKQPLLDVGEVVKGVGELFAPGAPYVLLSPWPTGDLRPLDLGLVGHPPLMYRPAGPVGPVTQPTGVEVRWAASPADLETAERILVDGYPIPELQPFSSGCVYAPRLLDSGSTRVVIGRVDGAPVATAAVHSAHGFNLVENVAVLPAGRGQGAGGAVTAAATRDVADRPAVLIASDDGQSVYERLGYLRVERWTMWIRVGIPPS